MENLHLNYAYAAGLFEGEGTVSYSSKGSWIVAINMTDLEPLERIYRTMGVVNLAAMHVVFIENS